jgi:pimeloyl-ACP methyl ester carboxylesterase
VRLPDGRRLNFRCSGSGAPTVVLEGGYGATSGGWYKVQPLIAKTNRVCSYDRAGYGASDPGPLPRDGRAVALDLDLGLRAAGIFGPYVMVGHSAGGLYVRLFFERRPRDVVGMVLVDPTVEHQDRRFAEIVGAGGAGLEPMKARVGLCLQAMKAHALPSNDPAYAYCMPKPAPGQAMSSEDVKRAIAARVPVWVTQYSELDTLLDSTSREVERGRQSYGELPLVVLTADGTYSDAPANLRPQIDGMWRELHRGVARRSSQGEERLVSGSSHMMMFDRPDAIAQAVDDVIARRRGGRSQGAR